MPSRGRPRDATTDRAVIEAALELLAENGWDGLTMEAVAQRAGVAKTTVYRRWASRSELLMGMAEELKSTVTPPHPVGLEEDLTALAREVIRALQSPLARRIVPRALAEAREHSEMAAGLEPFWASRRRLAIDILQRAVDAGKLRDDLDLEHAADAIYGPIYYRYLVTGATLRPEDADAIVRLAVGGMGRA